MDLPDRVDAVLLNTMTIPFAGSREVHLSERAFDDTRRAMSWSEPFEFECPSSIRGSGRHLSSDRVFAAGTAEHRAKQRVAGVGGSYYSVEWTTKFASAISEEDSSETAVSVDGVLTTSRPSRSLTG